MSSTRIRNIIAVALVLVSFVLLVPGLTKPLITITITFKPPIGPTFEIYNQTRSILQSIEDLHETGNDFVAGLILLFSVLVPFIKGALLAVAGVLKQPLGRYRVFSFVRSISKWAMADVFAVGVYVAFLAAKATSNFDAEIRIGFFYFVGYCVVSLLALQFMKIPDPRSPADE